MNTEKRKPLTTEQKAEIADRYQAGESLIPLGNAFSVAPTTIRQVLNDLQVPLRRVGRPSKDPAVSGRLSPNGIRSSSHSAELKRRREERLAQREARVSKIIAKRKAGMSLEQIGKEWGVSRERIRQLLKGTDVESVRVSRLNDIPAQDRKRMEHLWAEGTSAREIAELFEMPLHRVLAVVRKVPRQAVLSDQKQRILQLWDEGKSLTEIARLLTLPSYRTAQAVVHRHRRIRTRAETAQRDMEVRILAVRGLTNKEIASQLGMSHANVVRILNRAYAQ
ncbi:MAG: sigma factor-like helix-turn-helix DNA-binding protein [Armatimonas sp.]